MTNTMKQTFTVPYTLETILFLVLITYSGKGEDYFDSFPRSFLTSYFEHRSIRRVSLFFGNGNGSIGIGDVKRVVDAASSSLIQVNMSPLKAFLSHMDVATGHFIVLIYDNSTAANQLLLRASSASFFRAKYKWLLLTVPVFYVNLQNSLVDLEINVDSDVTIGISYPDGVIKLVDTYILGKKIHLQTVGMWSSNGTKEETLNLMSNRPFQRSNFDGYQLRVVTVNVNEFYSIATVNPADNSTTISGGYFGEVFKILSEALNFTYSVNVLKGYAFGVISSFSKGIPVWNGVVGELQSKRADVTACEVSLLPERELVIDYSWPLQIISRRLYIHRPTRSTYGSGGSKSETTWYKGGGFVRPFAMHVWLCVAASLLLFVGVSRLHAYFPSQLNEPSTFSSDFFKFVATLVQQGDEEDFDSSQSRRLILWTASVTYLIVYTSYGAKLASILASESEPLPPFETLEGLLTMSDWKLGFIDIGLGRVAFESAEEGSVMGQLWRERVKADTSVLVPDIVSGLKRTLQGRYAFLGFHTGVQALLVKSLNKEANFTASEMCRLMALPNDYLKGGIAFGFQDESPIRRIFNSWILAMRSSGLLDRLSKTWLPEALPCLQEVSVPTVALIDIAPALSALACGIALSLLFVLLENIYHLYKNKHNELPFHQ